MKKFLALTAIFALVLAACENPDDNNGTANTGTLFVYAGTASSLEIKNDSKGYTFPDTFLNQSNEVSITIKNTGNGTINLIGKPYINLDGATTVFSVSAQPESSTISQGKSVSFKIKFSPVNATESYVYVSIPNDSKNEPDFTFTVYGTGIRPKPAASIFFGNAEKHQNETIDAGDVVFTLSTDITVIIKNTGQLPLEIDTANITITGTDDSAFTITSRPNASIQPDSQSSFIIKCKPVKLDENRAVLTIPTNDTSRNPVVVNLRVNGKKGTPVPALTQGTNIITNNTLTPVNFGTVEISSYNSLMFTITNTGNIPLELTGDPVIESSNAVFAISSQPANKTIDPNGSVSFMIRFTPSAEGEVTGKITITNNTDTGEFVFPIKGTGYVKKPQIIVKQDTTTINPNGEYDFGNVATDETKTITFTVGNSGDANLIFETVNGNRVNLGNNTAGHFTVSQTISSVVAPDGTTTFTVSFNPKAEENNFTATVQIRTNSRNNDDYSFTVKGTGYVKKPQIKIYYSNNEVLQNGTIEAGDEVFTLSKTITVTIKNTGEIPLAIDTANITITGTDSAAFTKTNPNVSIQAGSQSTFTIKCEPVKVGQNNAVLTIPSNDSLRNPVVVNLRVTGIQGHPVLALTQGTTAITNNSLTPVDFGTVELGNSKSLNFTIKNTGNIALNLTGSPIVSSSNSVFTVISQPPNTTLNPAASTQFSVQYTPTAEGEVTGTITIINNSDETPYIFKVKGTGYEKKPQITMKQNTVTINPSGEYNFGTVATVDTKTITFTIGNSGDANLTFETVNGNRVNLENNSASHFSISQPSSTAVVTNGTTTFTVTFNPKTEANNLTATVRIKTNSRDNNDFSFTVKGNGYVKKPQITVKQGTTVINSGSEYNLGSVLAGKSGEFTFTIGNSGEADLNIDIIANARINLEDNTGNIFSVVQQPSAVVSIGNTTTFIICFNPTAVGTNPTAKVKIVTNSQNDNEFSFRVKGNGRNYIIGDEGPGGGIVFYVAGNQFKECSVELGQFNWNNAMTTAQSYTGGGFTNWHLPDKNELDLIYDNLKLNNLGNFYNSEYWSSSEVNYSWLSQPYESAWCQSFSNGSQLDIYLKTRINRVRAVRSFTF